MFLLHLWNKQYGNGAKFVVENKDTGKFSEYSPARPADVAWVNDDLTKNPEYKSWEDFEKEPVDNLQNVIM